MLFEKIVMKKKVFEIVELGEVIEIGIERIKFKVFLKIGLKFLLK